MTRSAKIVERRTGQRLLRVRPSGRRRLGVLCISSLLVLHLHQRVRDSIVKQVEYACAPCPCYNDPRNQRNQTSPSRNCNRRREPSPWRLPQTSPPRLSSITAQWQTRKSQGASRLDAALAPSHQQRTAAPQSPNACSLPSALGPAVPIYRRRCMPQRTAPPRSCGRHPPARRCPPRSPRSSHSTARPRVVAPL